MRALSQCIAVLILAHIAMPGEAQQPARYVGRLANGQAITGAAIVDWHSHEANPRLDNQALWDAQNPFRWLRDSSLPLPGLPESFVEMVTGDRLPGAATAHVSPKREVLSGLPAHFIVEPAVELAQPRPYFAENVRVAEHTVRRIVWRRRTIDQYEPGTAFFRDGRSLKYRSVRFGPASAVLLLDDGPREAPFTELAELHLHVGDWWDAYWDELAILSPQGESPLLQIETTDGLVATTSRNRLFPLAEAGANDSKRWLHGIQPAWSLDLLWVPHRNIVVRRSFAPHEVLLSRLTPQVEAPPSPLRGSGAVFANNRSVDGDALHSGGHEYGWGWSMLGAGRLRFTIPDYVASFQGRVGLDRSVGSGGSIQARIFLDKTDAAPLWQSAPLVGTLQTTDWGSLSFPRVEGQHRTLILEIDPLLRNAPPGADPLDIRDAADWLDPLLLLNPQQTQEQISRRTPIQVFAWKDWRTDVTGPLHWQTRFELAPGFDSVRLGVAAMDQPLRLSQSLTPSDTQQWLVVLAEHAPNAKERAKLEVRAAGEMLAVFDVPSYSPDPSQLQPLAVALPRLENSSERHLLEILQTSTPDESPVFWKEARVMDQPPMLMRVLEDEGEFAAIGDAKPDGLEWVTSQQYSGRRAVRISAGGQFTMQLPGIAPIRERPALGEFRYVRFAFRKAGKGRVAIELNRQEAERPVIRYDAGLGEPSYGGASRVWSLELPDQWIVTTRDLFKEFGAADITGLTLGAPDGEYALFDHIYLARTERDFDLFPATPAPDETNREARRMLAKSVLERILPATVAIDFGGRFSTGVLLSREGDVLTAGHAVVAPGKDVAVLLSDGRRLKGKTFGVAREHDLGLVRLDEPGEWPTVAIGDARNLPKDQLYVGVAHTRRVETQAAPAAHVVGLQRVLQGEIWTDFDIADWCAGGPLVNKDAQLVGIQRGRSQFGGFLYTQLLDFPETLTRLKNGEVWGAWAFGSGPMMGLQIETDDAGCRVAEVFPETPAVEAGIRVGDLIVKVDGQEVRRLDDIYRRLGESDPGKQVAIELRRGGQTTAATISLIPRTP